MCPEVLLPAFPAAPFESEADGVGTGHIALERLGDGAGIAAVRGDAHDYDVFVCCERPSSAASSPSFAEPKRWEP